MLNICRSESYELFHRVSPGLLRVCLYIFCIISADLGRPANFQRILHLFINWSCIEDNSTQLFMTLFISVVANKFRV